MSEVQRFPDLQRLQTIFWRLLAAPEGASSGARALRSEGAIGSEDLSDLVRADDRMKPLERVDVYADMYFFRLRDCLAEDFPKLAAWIGPSRLHNLVTDYLLAHPPTHFSLRELGRPFSGFVEDHTLAREFPGIADLAALEWARVDVFDEADAQPLTRSDLLTQAAAAPDTFTLALIPAARRLIVSGSTLDRWRALPEHAGAAPGPAGEAISVRVWRQEFDVFHRSIDPVEAQCLAALSGSGTTLAQLGEIVAAATPTAQAATRLAELLGVWSTDALLSTPA